MHYTVSGSSKQKNFQDMLILIIINNPSLFLEHMEIVLSIKACLEYEL